MFVILHADLDAFYASVEQRDDPSLRGRPVIVGGGVVLAASYEARRRGVRTAMGGGLARRLCPDAVVVPPRMDAYAQASRDVFAVLEDAAPVVEAISIDEAFLDVRGLEHVCGTPVEIAERLRRDVRNRAGLAITVGIATTKHLAKVASASAKPDGLLLVPAGRELEFLHPLPVERLWGVGPATAEKLHARGLSTVAQLAALAELELVEIVGRAAGRRLHALAHNRDPRRVRRRRRRRSMGAQRALGRGPKTAASLDAALVALVERLCGRLRAAGRACRTVVLRLRYSDYTRATRSHTLAGPTAATEPVLAAARELLAAALPQIRERGITLIGVTVTNLDHEGPIQLPLPLEPRHRRALDAAVDDIRDRYGRSAITPAVLVGRDDDATVPLLPD